MPFVSASQFNFEPLVNGLAVDALGVVHSTDAAWNVRIRDLAAAKFRRGQLKYKLKMSQSPTSGEITIRLKAGSVTKNTVVVTLGADTEYNGIVDADLSGIAGDTPLTLEYEVTTATGAALTTMAVAAVLEVSTIAVVSSC